MDSPVSFTGPLRIIRDNTQKLLLTAFYFPLLAPYYSFEEKFGVAFQTLGENRIDGESLATFVEAMSEFDFQNVREIINNYPLLISQSLLQNEEDNKFFSEIHGSVRGTWDKYAPSEQKLQGARNSMQNFSRMFYNNLAELEKCWRQIDSAIRQTTDKAAHLKQGWSGGAIGAALGTMLFPGVGTIAGGALGGYVMSKVRNSAIIDQTHEHVIGYYQNTRKIIGILHAHSKECYLINGRIFDDFVLNQLKLTYNEIKATHPDADKFVFDYLRNQGLLIEGFYSSELNEGCGFTWGEATNTVEQFLKESYTA